MLCTLGRMQNFACTPVTHDQHQSDNGRGRVCFEECKPVSIIGWITSFVVECSDQPILCCSWFMHKEYSWCNWIRQFQGCLPALVSSTLCGMAKSPKPAAMLLLRSYQNSAVINYPDHGEWTQARVRHSGLKLDSKEVVWKNCTFSLKSQVGRLKAHAHQRVYTMHILFKLDLEIRFWFRAHVSHFVSLKLSRPDKQRSRTSHYRSASVLPYIHECWAHSNWNGERVERSKAFFTEGSVLAYDAVMICVGRERTAMHVGEQDHNFTTNGVDNYTWLE